MADAHAEDKTALLQFLRREMDRARLCRLPVTLALILPEDPEELELVRSHAHDQARSFDFAALLSGGRVALVFSVTPMQAGERAVGAMLRRIRQQGEADAVCSAGLAGYGGCVDLGPEALLERAAQALAKARSLGGNRLEVAPSPDLELASHETLVRASEKQFLFTGKRKAEE